MLGKRKYNVSGHDVDGKYVEAELWASSAREALKIAQAWDDGNTYTVARKVGCGCGG
ncbi:hypothetical protein [Bacillus haynesii]|uniref:hypothetical protein n=1 Tax=Bacillus haynesii TaxID=1925021 RepID=UPI00227EE31B|nr:hypothetical protein [Bacillus haynesii]MCY7861184.1 hypothetical protein [Bacillus haynesii]MCY8549110.1 hypothetical protein [Bacillus haynesii]